MTPIPDGSGGYIDIATGDAIDVSATPSIAVTQNERPPDSDPSYEPPAPEKPASGEVGDRYGPRAPIKTKQGSTLPFHGGLDIRNNEGTPIKAILDGTVLWGGCSEDYGNHLFISHDEKGWAGLFSLYAHLDGLPQAEVGSLVSKGQVIGIMGDTGKSEGSHLHFEIHYNYKRLNPEQFIFFN